MSSVQKNILVSGISKKSDGEMIVARGDVAIENRAKFFTSLEIDPASTIIAGLNHGNNVRVVGQADADTIIAQTDALVTNQTGIILTITVADCLPVYIFNSEHSVVALVHAGWRGVRSGIVTKTIETMKEEFKVSGENLSAYIGPHIKECHFEVYEEVASEFAAYQSRIIKRDGRIFINLAGVVTDQLVAAGLDEHNISVSKECSYDCEEYFSYRRDKPSLVQAQVAYIGIL